MQLMALEVVQQTIEDAGYTTAGSRSPRRASVIVGVSGGLGEFGVRLRRPFGDSARASPASPPKRSTTCPNGPRTRSPASCSTSRRPRRQPLQLRRRQLHHRRRLRVVAGAIYQAVSELVTGRSDMVVAGGVDTVQGPFGYLCFSKTQALSPRGRCRTFDATADGIVISEGVADGGAEAARRRRARWRPDLCRHQGRRRRQRRHGPRD